MYFIIWAGGKLLWEMMKDVLLLLKWYDGKGNILAGNVVSDIENSDLIFHFTKRLVAGE
jgi:hypothetical protein